MAVVLSNVGKIIVMKFLIMLLVLYFSIFKISMSSKFPKTEQNCIPLLKIKSAEFFKTQEKTI